MIDVFLIGIDCFKPANGETVSMETIPTITVDMSLELLKRKVESLQRKGQSNNMHEPIITCNVHLKGKWVNAKEATPFFNTVMKAKKYVSFTKHEVEKAGYWRSSPVLFFILNIVNKVEWL